METVILLVVVVAILAYYGFTSSLEKLANMATREVDHLQDHHDVSLAVRTAKLGGKLNDDVVNKATEAKAKLKALRDAEGS